MQNSGLAGQLLKIKDQYKCLVKLLEKMESAKYTIKEAVQAIQKLGIGEDTCNINQYIKKKKQNNDISEIINMEGQDISPAVYHMLQNSQPTCLKDCWPRTKILIENVRHYLILHFNVSTW